MANITTFATLKSEILGLIGRAPADPVYQMVVRDINRELRLMAMEATTTVTEAASISLPPDFLQVQSVYRNTQPRYPLRPTTPQALNRNHDTSGIPKEYAIVDDGGTKKMLLNPEPNSTESIELRYYAALDELSADEDTNDVLTLHPDIFLYGSLYHHANLIRDTQAALEWGASYRAAMRAAETADAKTRVAGVPLEPTVEHATP